MSARAIASATISFGLVSIPVKLYAAGNPSSGVRFNLVHGQCGTRLKQQYICPKDGEMVERSDMAKGYEFAKGQYVLFSDEEIRKLQAQATQTLEITEFVPQARVDAIYFDKNYYLGPDRGGDRAYKLLARALAKSGYVALAKYAARGKQYLVMVRPYEGGLLMHQLHYSHEIRPIAEVPLGDAVIKPAELKLALQIVEQGMTDEFQPKRYEDEVRQRMLQAIDKKVEGQEIIAPPEAPVAEVIDLMEALKKSLSKSDTRKPAKQAPHRSAAGTAARKKTAKRARKARG